MPRKARKRGPKGVPWYRKFNDTWSMPKVNGKARPILDADGVPIKGKDNREQALSCWHEIVAREKAHTKGRDNTRKSVRELLLW